jgi:cytochrome P450
MNATPPPDWDPRAASVQNDQRRAYDALRERCPVAYSTFLHWSLFRHADIVAVLADPTTYSSASRHRAIPNGMDPPEHARYRSVLEPYFGAQTMAAFEPDCRAIATRLTEAILALGEVDFSAEFAGPFALQAQCAFLGWPLDMWEQLVGWTHGNQQAAYSGDRAAGQALARDLVGHVAEAIRVRRRDKRSGDHDLTARLMATDVDGQPFSDDDIVSILRNWIAGHGTVAAALGIVMLHIAQRQELQQRLRQDPALVAAAIDEILRIDDPLVTNRRTTTRAVEIGGRSIAAGEQLTLMWIAANRDENAFDGPEALRLDREQERNLVFGAGIHDCIGAPLARLELRVALVELLARTRHIELTGAPSRSTYPSNGLKTLTLRLN